ncbi:argininosuccinate synthase [Candidatus Obscuribacterales bacterium]|nr:argininosuccinate synthase [Candidatus Obscuribacterales bacterium]MBX3149738.1 argininosuccinate synthase [Candidatus Obscuribacterales bacterium]
MKKILLAYSGGLDTSCILTWLKETYNVPVVAYCANVGQGEDFDAVVEKAMKTGAEKCIVDDLCNDFVNNYVFESIKANGVYEHTYLMGTSLARPCIAQGMITAALKEGCDAIAHGATGKGNDQVRFELAVKSLAPHLQIIAPWREWNYSGRNDLIEYAKKHGIPVPVTKEKPYSMDANLMHISYEGGILEDPAAAPPEDIYLWTTNPEQAPDKAEEITIEFKCGVPVAINGEALGPVDLLNKANEIGAKHGVGRVDLVENRFVGIKSRGVYETPGATLLMQAHVAVESLTLDREVSHMKQEWGLKFAELTYNGFWFAPEAVLLKNAIDASQANVNGWAKLKLYKGNSIVVGRQSQNSLYDEKLSSFEAMGMFDKHESGGFINVNGLRLTAWSKCNESVKKSLQPAT